MSKEVMKEDMKQFIILKPLEKVSIFSLEEAERIAKEEI